MAQAENRTPGLNFADRNGNAYQFANDDLDKQVFDPQPAPFPDILANMPGVLSTDKDTITPMTLEPHVTWQDLAQVAAANSGIDTTPVTPEASSPEVRMINDKDNDEFPILPNYTLQFRGRWFWSTGLQA